MTRVIFHNDQFHYTKGVKEISLSVSSYRGLIKELGERYPGLTDAELNAYIVAVDGVVVPRPFLEKLNPDSEVVFIRKIAAG